ncbi:carcinoembryonic antigen-related cell adhesion molecule 16-like [Hyla sarda]|uniref:carcinoembryonic antigen-related cell adhesion molecule 16-like n=1 Tax=Hyla sarda TaxID=327740 RepID=UPI0024C45E44|nr:carcinoembryonic antigen-related cell adhesion molecule 16-like [Hyla sarda]
MSISSTKNSTNTNAVAWYKDLNISEKYHIISYFPGNGTNMSAPLYTSRVTSISDKLLEISNLQITDTGKYSVTINSLESIEEAFIVITVYEAIGKPNLTASTTIPKETDTITLICQIANITNIAWTGPGMIFRNKTIVSKDNRTVTVPNITWRYTGFYTCEARKPPISSLSNSLYIEVAYGPEQLKIKGTLTVGFGSQILLICIVDSVPQPDFQWKHNNKYLETHNTNIMKIANARFSDQGTYTCEAKNRRTLFNATGTVTVSVSAASVIGITITFVIILIIIGGVVMFRKRIFSDTDEPCEDSDEETENPASDESPNNAKNQEPEEEF